MKNLIEHNLNREKIMAINDEIMNIAVSVNYDCAIDKERARKRLNDLIEERKRLFEEGNISVCQLKLRQMLKEALPGMEIKDEYRIGALRLDLYIPDLNIAFEYDGPQHYVFPNHIHKTRAEFEQQQTRDRLKDKLCQRMGITLVRIRYDEELSMKTILAKVITAKAG